MPYDFKKEKLYRAGDRPEIVTVPPVNYITGPFETEPETVDVMDAFLTENGYVNDLTDRRLHHEIYLSDARKITPDRWRTFLRHPIRKISP